MTAVGTATPASPRVVVLDPPATAMRWHGIDAGFEPALVDSVRLGSREVLVAIELATICGSDLHTTAGRRPAATPLVLGHEQVGRVADVGDDAVDVDGASLTVGDRVVWSVTVHCGRCTRCTRGLPQKCERLRKLGHERSAEPWLLTGGFATHAHLPDGTAIVRVPDDADAAAMAQVGCATATAWAAVDALGDIGGRTVLVLGAGLVGLSVVAIAASRGGHVTVVEPGSERRDRARSFGANVARESAPADERFDAVVEASGNAVAVGEALRTAAIGGTVALIGSVAPGPSVALDPEAVVRGHLTIRGVHNYAPADLRAAAAWMAEHPAHGLFAALVSVTVPLARLGEGMHIAATTGAVRVGVVTNGSTVVKNGSHS